MLNFLFEVCEVLEFLFIVAASVFIAFAISDGELPLAKMCSLRKKQGTSMFAADK